MVHLPLRNRLQEYSLYTCIGELKTSVQNLMASRHDPIRKIVSLTPKGPVKGHVLLSHVNTAFLLGPSETITTTHTHDWDAMNMAQTFLERGYCVDTIHYKNSTFLPRKDYDVFIDVRWNFERLAPILNPECLKLMHIDTSNLLFHNAAEAQRLLDLQQRRHLTLPPRRFEMPNRALEFADCATILGNAATMATYAYANKQLYPMPVSSPVSYPWPEDKDFDACRKHFVWFGSGGMVHKGVDLILEAFAQMPDYRLSLCGPILSEPDFVAAFHKELYETPNIHLIGWVDIEGKAFQDILNQCIGLIYPSCAEGQAAAVVVCCHAGLIPIVSNTSGVDVEDFGTVMQSCSIEEIKASLQALAERPAQELAQRARASWEFARAVHTRERFAKLYRESVDTILAETGRGTTRQPAQAA